MIDIKQYLDTIQVASRGEEVRDAIVHALDDIGALANDEITDLILKHLDDAFKDGGCAMILCTSDEYNGLSEDAKLDGTIYFLYDRQMLYLEGVEYGGYAKATAISILKDEEYEVLSTEEKLSGTLYFILDRNAIYLEGKQYVGNSIDKDYVTDVMRSTVDDMADNSLAYIVSLTSAEYDQLSEVEKHNDNVYLIEDTNAIKHNDNDYGLRATLNIPVDNDLLASSENPVTNARLVEEFAKYIKGADIEINYLNKSDAASTYLKQSDASDEYLSKSDANTTYLKKSDAGSTYATTGDLGDLSDALFGEIHALTDGAPETFDTFKELADWVDGHKDVANVRLITRAQYDALSSSEKLSGTLYLLTDERSLFVNGVLYSSGFGLALGDVLSTLDANSTYPVQSKVIKAYIDNAVDGMLTTSDVDDELTDDSTNPVQGGAIKSYVDSIAGDFLLLSNVSEELDDESIYPVQGGAIKTYIDDTLTGKSELVVVEELTSAEYKELSETDRNINILYFLKDTNEIYYNGKHYGLNDDELVRVHRCSKAEYEAIEFGESSDLGVYFVEDTQELYFNNVRYSGAPSNIVTISAANYEALSEAEKTNGSVYILTNDTGVYLNGIEHGGGVTLDDELDDTSENGVTNAAVATAINGISSQVRDINNALSSKVTTESGKGLSTNDFTNSYKQSLDTLDTTINNAVSGKVDKVAGKDLSSNDFTNDYKTKIDSAASFDYKNSTVSVVSSSGVYFTSTRSFPSVIYSFKEYYGQYDYSTSMYYKQISSSYSGESSLEEGLLYSLAIKTSNSFSTSDFQYYGVARRFSKNNYKYILIPFYAENNYNPDSTPTYLLCYEQYYTNTYGTLYLASSSYNGTNRYISIRKHYAAKSVLAQFIHANRTATLKQLSLYDLPLIYSYNVSSNARILVDNNRSPSSITVSNFASSLMNQMYVYVGNDSVQFSNLGDYLYRKFNSINKSMKDLKKTVDEELTTKVDTIIADLSKENKKLKDRIDELEAKLDRYGDIIDSFTDNAKVESKWLTLKGDNIRVEDDFIVIPDTLGDINNRKIRLTNITKDKVDDVDMSVVVEDGKVIVAGGMEVIDGKLVIDASSIEVVDGKLIIR